MLNGDSVQQIVESRRLGVDHADVGVHRNAREGRALLKQSPSLAWLAGSALSPARERRSRVAWSSEVTVTAESPPVQV